MNITIDDVINSYRESVDFFISKAKGVLLDFTKITVLELAVQILMAVIIIGVGFLTGDAMSGEFSMPVIVVLLILIIPSVLISAALNASAYSLLEERTKGRVGDVIGIVKRLFVPVGKYTLLAFMIVVAAIVATVALALLAAMVNPIAGIIPVALGLAFIAVFGFGVQFAIPEVVLRGAGAVEAMKRSWKTVTSNPFEVLVFDIILVVVVLALALVFGVLNLVGALFGTMPIGEILNMVYSFAMSLVSSVVMTTVAVLSVYFFWKRMTSEPVKAPEQVKSRKPAKAQRKKR